MGPFPLEGNSNQIKVWLRSRKISEEVVEIITDFSPRAMLGLSLEDLKALITDQKQAIHLFCLLEYVRNQLEGKSLFLNNINIRLYTFKIIMFQVV